MASVDKRPNGQWRARWREYPGGPQKTKSFPRKVDADRFLTKVSHDLLVGAYVDPAAGRVTVEDYYRGTWLPRLTPTWRPRTLAMVVGNYERHVLPAFGSRPLSSVRRADIEAFYVALPLAPRTVGVLGVHLGQMFRAAVEDNLIAKNPAAGARRPLVEPTKAIPPSMDVIAKIEAELPESLRIAVTLAVGVGLRQGEVCGLKVDRVHFLRRELRVDHQLSRSDGVLTLPKTASSIRTVPLLADVVVERLAEHLRRFPAEPDGFVVRDPSGNPIHALRLCRAWGAAAIKAGAPGTRFHDLRHVFASTLLSNRVSVKAVADWMGHASAVTTLETYAHLMPADVDVARSAFNAMFAPAAEDSLGTGSLPGPSPKRLATL